MNSSIPEIKIARMRIIVVWMEGILLSNLKQEKWWVTFPNTTSPDIQEQGMIFGFVLVVRQQAFKNVMERREKRKGEPKLAKNERPGKERQVMVQRKSMQTTRREIWLMCAQNIMKVRSSGENQIFIDGFFTLEEVINWAIGKEGVNFMIIQVF